MVCSTDRSKAVVPVLVLLFVALWFILRGDLLYVFPCVILFLCFSVPLVLRLPRLVSLSLCCFVVYSTRRFVVCLSVCYFVLVFFSPFSIAITSLGEERANLSAFRTFVRFVLVWICRLPLPLGVWEGLRFVIVALPGLLLPFFSDIVCFPCMMCFICLWTVSYHISLSHSTLTFLCTTK